MSAVFLLLGSNTFPRFVYLQHALGMLRQLPMELKQVSPFYETAPWGKTDQSDFLNVAVQVFTSLPPLALLERLKAIEQQLGRTSAQKWGPREIDLDILFYGEEMIHTESLVIPHPELQHRRFALVPLHDIAPDFVHPVFKKKVSKLLEQSADKGEVRYYCEGDFQSKTITVTGKVQGVGFRFYTERVAKELGVKGTVRNLPNGNVFCEAEAPDATLNTFISFCHQGPSTAQVNEVVVTEKEPEFFKRFEIVR